MPNPLTTEDRESQRVMTRDGRFYVWGENRYPGVTTILSNGVPKPFLINWAKKVTSEYAVENIDTLNNLIQVDERGAIDWLKGAAYRNRDAAGATGSILHDFAEAYSLGLPVDVTGLTGPAVPMARQFIDFVELVKPEFEAVEAVVFNTVHGYAGTLDSIIRLDYEPVLKTLGFDEPVTVMCDIKTGKGVYGEVALQLAAYRNAEFIGQADGSTIPMPETGEVALVLHVRPERWRLIPVVVNDEVFDAFLTAKASAEWVNGLSKDVVGNPLMSRKAS